MRWTSAVGAAVMMVLPVAAAADGIVVRAEGPSAARFPLGRKLADGARVTLARGDQLVVLDPHGTRTLSGPGSFTIGGAAQTASPTVLAALSTMANGQRARIGAVRQGDATRTRRPNIWFVDTATEGAVCVIDPKSVELWRPVSDRTGRLTIIDAAGGSAKVDWIKGQDVHAWPAALPVADGHRYTLAAETGPTTTISFRLLPAAPGDLAGLGSALAGGGCKGQLDVLIAASEATPAG